MTTLHPAATQAGTPRRAWFALAILLLPVLLVSIDNTVLSFALPTITEELRPDASTQLWMIDIYSLVLASLLVTMGGLGDRFGRRRLLLIGATGFAVVSVVAAFSPTAELLVAARAALGFFGAMLMPSTLGLIRNIFPDADRRRLAIAIWAAAFAVGSSLGPIIGGALLQAFPWGAVFLVAVPILIPLLVLGPFLIPESKDPHPGPLDIPSVIVSFLGMLGIVYAIKTLAHDGFGDPVQWVPAAAAGVLGVVGVAWFVRRQLKSDNPLLDMRLFAHGPFTASILANFLSIVALIAFIFFVSQHLQLVLGLSPLLAGLVLLPGAVISVVSGLGVVKLARRFRPENLLLVGLLLVAFGFGLAFVMRGDLSIAAIVITFGFLELGIGLSQTLSNDIIVSSVPPAKAGAASAISETAYELGAVIGTATLGTVLTAFYRAQVEVPAGLTPEQTHAAGETLGGAVSVSEQLPADLGAALLASAQHAFESGVGVLTAAATVLTLLAAVVVWVVFRRLRTR
ncbi:MFS transporter [Herbiconiux sp.]|uniref:MFS transporter n=1 Tax=Herbiconiux sp. TaxID=1871186 RepID=UPI0025C464E0|nr:MFS transporter [Herbiconiux sp.]